MWVVGHPKHRGKFTVSLNKMNDSTDSAILAVSPPLINTHGSESCCRNSVCVCQRTGCCTHKPEQRVHCLRLMMGEESVWNRNRRRLTVDQTNLPAQESHLIASNAFKAGFYSVSCQLAQQNLTIKELMVSLGWAISRKGRFIPANMWKSNTQAIYRIYLRIYKRKINLNSCFDKNK